LVWIVGGDFNCRAGRAIYLPITSTHQSGHIIDGFFADQNGTNFEIKQIAAAQTWTGAANQVHIVQEIGNFTRDAIGFERIAPVDERFLSFVGMVGVWACSEDPG
jgi:hypothetical protein